MKKAILTAIMIVALLGVGAFAGVLAGVSLDPTPGKALSPYLGWQSDTWAATITKANIVTWTGEWTFGVYWTPALWDETTTLRAGGGIVLDWNKRKAITYEGIALFVGVEKWVTKQVGLYAQLNSTSKWALSPSFGVEINFWSPAPVQTSGG